MIGAQFGDGSSLSFGNIQTGQSATMRVTLINFATESFTIASVTTDDPAFTATDECDGQYLNIGDTCAISVTFSPTEDGTYQDGALIIATDPAREKTGIALVGSAGPASAPAVSTTTPAEIPSDEPPPDQTTPDETPSG
jgi:type 1 fimbria pilin